MSVWLFAGEVQVDAIAADDRGLAYGDGVFETMRVHAGDIPLWPRHRERLQAGARRLGLPLPRLDVLEARIGEAAAGADAGVLKLLVSRGRGGRGYAAPPAPTPTWLLSLHPLPAVPEAGLRLHWCDTRLALQPALAGIKHCNRLEQVLGRAEADAAGCDEGLMCSTAGDVACATSANLLVLRHGRWLTPPVGECGVAGVCRGWLVDHGLVEVANLSPVEVEASAAVALCNAVRGILPVSALDGRHWSSHVETTALQARLAAAFPMFQMHTEVA